MTIDEMIAVLQAVKEGKQIQVRVGGESPFYDCLSSPVWDFAMFEYRIKPEPREFWLTPGASG